MGMITKKSFEYNADSEAESERFINEYKDKQMEEGYSVIGTSVKYKNKKDKKTGVITDEVWQTKVTISYEV